MKLEEFAALNPEARAYGRGWRGPCPSCGGNNLSKFSFTERDGKILGRCFAGCSTTAICEALGIELKDLFLDAGLTLKQRQALPPRTRCFDWREMSSALEFASESHWIRAQSVFKAARQLNIKTMIDEDLDRSWKCLAIGFHSLRVSENLGITALQIRCTCLEG